MIQIAFSDLEQKRRALGFLAGRFPFRSSSDGSMLVTETGLAAMALENISFTVIGLATYEQQLPALRDPASAPV